MASRKSLISEGFNKKGNYYESYDDDSYKYWNGDGSKYSYDGDGHGFYSNPHGTTFSGGRPYESWFDYENGTREDKFLSSEEDESENGEYQILDPVDQLDDLFHGIELNEDPLYDDDYGDDENEYGEIQGTHIEAGKEEDHSETEDYYAVDEPNDGNSDLEDSDLIGFDDGDCECGVGSSDAYDYDSGDNDVDDYDSGDYDDDD